MSLEGEEFSRNSVMAFSLNLLMADLLDPQRFPAKLWSFLQIPFSENFAGNILILACYVCPVCLCVCKVGDGECRRQKEVFMHVYLKSLLA